MVVQINLSGFAMPAVPFEYKPPLLIYTDRMKPLEVSGQFFEMVTRGHSQVLIRHCVVDQLNLTEKGAVEP